MALGCCEPGSEVCSAELPASADLAVCGRADGSILLMRFSRDALLRSRFHAPAPSAPSVRSVAMPGHTGPVYSTSLSRCGQYALSGSQELPHP